MAFGLENEQTAFIVNDAITSIGYRKSIEPNFELGPWSYPVTEFLTHFFTLKKNSPQYTDEEAAAVTYFGMIAEQPEPTAQVTDISIDWNAVDSIAFDIAAYDPAQAENGPNMLLPYFETLINRNDLIRKDKQPYLGIKKNDSGKWQIYFIWKNVRTTRSLQESYIESVYHLNRYLYYNGLYTGIQKTLSEESRRLQGLRAQALASQQAAAKALALSRASENVQEETIERYEKQLEAAQVKQQEIDDYLRKLSNTPTGQGSTTTAGASGVLPLVVGAALAALALR